MTEWTESEQSSLLSEIADFRLTRKHRRLRAEELHGHKAKSAADADEPGWWSVLIELDKGFSISEFQKAVDKEKFAEELIIPANYDALERADKQDDLGQKITIFARKKLIDRLNKESKAFSVVYLHLGAKVPSSFLDTRAPVPVSAPPEIEVPDDAVVMAIIDYSIAIAHELFRTSGTESRISHAWVMGTAPKSNGVQTTMGRVLNKPEIDSILAKCTDGGILDEDQFYNETGQFQPGKGVFSDIAFSTSHGTGVTALAAGYDMFGKVKNRPIICAILPTWLVEDTTGTDSLPLVNLAFHDIKKQAGRFRTNSGKPAPLVFNFSFGNVSGSHTIGEPYASLFESSFAPSPQKPQKPPKPPKPQKMWMTLAGGNSNLQRLHAKDDGSSPDKPTVLDLTVLPDDRTANGLQIWLPIAEPDKEIDFATISVTPPGGLPSGTIQTIPGQRTRLVNEHGLEIARLACQFVGGSISRSFVTFSVNPTTSSGSCDDLARPGVWKFTIARNTAKWGKTSPFYIWVLRDETLPGFRTGARQAFFSNPDYQIHGPNGRLLPVDPQGTDCPVRRAGTLSGFAAGPTPAVVAAYSEKEAELSAYSAAGPLPKNAGDKVHARAGPDLSAKGDESVVFLGVLTAGSKCGSRVRMNGTSVAAPQAARLASNDILSSHCVTASAWAGVAVQEAPFPLHGKPGPTRTGRGAVQCPTRSWLGIPED